MAIAQENKMLICSVCGQEVYRCDLCGEYFEKGETIFCKGTYSEKHECEACQ